ncbi:CLUMA_CG004014, isoform A [Clunio marinus]|uniref:CLUMA_CG004014, isoform A n=1 Tax=Clunio marinus TaxID=568069 RepID=A0A1J1HSH3_9DIPT|nr:CLUMA_CG004014, isoform A [Clunio marinus]
MLTNQKKSKGVVNWFSSLRRQPKKQNSLDSSKLLQKSCIDLSGGAGETSSEHDLYFNATTKPSKVKLNSNDKTSITSNFCTNCCKFSSNTTSPTFGAQHSPVADDDLEQIDQLRKVLIVSEENFSSARNRDGDKTEKSKFASNLLLYNKKEEIGCTTRTLTTKISAKKSYNKSEIESLMTNAINTHQQLINHRQLLSAKNRDGMIFDDNGRLMTSDNDETVPLPFVSSILDVSSIEFIDSSAQNSDIYNRANMEHSCSCNISKFMPGNYNTLPNKSSSEWYRQQSKDEVCEVVQEMDSNDSNTKHSTKEKQMSIGRKKFNMDPKKGIEYLYENHLLRIDAQDVAHFLYKGEGLNKTAIGDFLGEKNSFNEQVLKAFVELHDFTNLILVQALRQFLWSFRLPGEAQKIDRMMECFAQRYCQLNPDIFTNTDTCYVLSFAIIMLNTSLHNPSVKDKPTVEQFISMNRGINNGGDLSRELLESLYESIRTEPFKIPQDDGNDLMHTFFNPDKEGWLWKQGGRYKSWKRRWFILNDNCLYYFEYTTDKEPRGIIPLENILVRECKVADKSKPHCFELYAGGYGDIIKACKTDSEGKVVEGKHTVYRMSAATEEEKNEWIKCLTHSIAHNPFYEILVQRKKNAVVTS